MQAVQLLLLELQAAQGGEQAAQVMEATSAKVPLGQLPAVTQDELEKKSVAQEVQAVAVVQLKQGGRQGEQMLELLPK
jgi:hypothetical protein